MILTKNNINSVPLCVSPSCWWEKRIRSSAIDNTDNSSMLMNVVSSLCRNMLMSSVWHENSGYFILNKSWNIPKQSVYIEKTLDIYMQPSFVNVFPIKVTSHQRWGVSFHRTLDCLFKHSQTIDWEMFCTSRSTWLILREWLGTFSDKASKLIVIKFWNSTRSWYFI